MGKTNEINDFYSVVIPINSKGEVLLGLRLEDGVWTTPAGGSNSVESPFDCAIREAKEEADLEIIPKQLEHVKTVLAPNGKKVFCFLFRCGQQFTTPEYDPDKEVREWVWISPENFPKGFYTKKNKNRKDTIIEALAKFHYLTKAEQFMSDLEKNDLDLYKKVRSMRQIIDEDEERDLKKRAPKGVNPEKHESCVMDVKEQGQNVGSAHAICTSSMKKGEPLDKSVVQMAHLTEGSDIETSSVAIDRATMDHEWENTFTEGMEGYSYGELPRPFELDKGTLYLSKVDDGLYSGVFKYKTPMIKGETDEMSYMEDSVKVRIEKQTIPTLCQFLIAKNWISYHEPEVEIFDSPQEHIEHEMEEAILYDEVRDEVIEHEGSESDRLAQKITMLNLIDKIMGLS